VEGDAAVGGEAVEDRHGERGDNGFRDVAGRVVEGDQVIGVPFTSTRCPPVLGGSFWGRRISGCTEAITSLPASSSAISLARSSSVITSACSPCLSLAYSAKGR